MKVLAADGMLPLPEGDWLPIRAIVNLLRNPPAEVFHSRVPYGLKSSVYCVVNNQDNVNRVAAGRRRAFDDCGAWNAHGTRITKYPYLNNDDGTMHRIVTLASTVKSIKSMVCASIYRSIHSRQLNASQQSYDTPSLARPTRYSLVDAVFQVLQMAQTDEIVRSVQIAADRVPSIVLYNERQLQDLKSFCFDRKRGSVLSFDKTFNLGCLYVTSASEMTHSVSSGALNSTHSLTVSTYQHMALP